MEVPAFRFGGYGPGDTDFGARLAAADPQAQADFNSMLDRVSGFVTSAAPTGYAVITVIGYSDRQDRADLSCDQRRESEEEASTNRAVAAWDWVTTAVGQRPGVGAGPWWDESPYITWALVGAGATRLPNPVPTDESQRAENRRVTFLVSEFPSL